MLITHFLDELGLAANCVQKRRQNCYAEVSTTVEPVRGVEEREDFVAQLLGHPSKFKARYMVAEFLQAIANTVLLQVCLVIATDIRFEVELDNRVGWNAVVVDAISDLC